MFGIGSDNNDVPVGSLWDNISSAWDGFVDYIEEAGEVVLTSVGLKEKKDDSVANTTKATAEATNNAATVEPSETPTPTDSGDSDMPSNNTNPDGSTPTMQPITIETVQDVYDKLFTSVGGVDDNNRYVNMSTRDLTSVQLFEPTLSVMEMVVSDVEKTAAQDIPERIAYRLPLIFINEQMVSQKHITEFVLDYSGFAPRVIVELMDFENKLLSTNSIRDGSIIKVYVGGNGDELYYKPIRQDFMITDIQKINGGNQNKGDWMTYRLTGSLNVPMGYRKESWSNNKVTSLQEMCNLAVYCGLGFSTNFTYDTCDVMKWENTLGTTYFEFMQWIAEHACYSPNTFFTTFIDQYYVLNFVEVHSLLSHGGDKKDTPAIIYSNFQQAREPKSDKVDGKNQKTEDQIEITKGDTPTNNTEQRVTYYFLSNHSLYKGWTNYIESWNEISEGFSSMNEGYKKHVTYSDYSAEGMGKNCEFIICPIDNLKRDSETQEIESLPAEVSQESYIPINLLQMNKTEYQDQNLNSVDKMSEVESYEHFGQVDTINMFKMFYYAEAQNNYQMSCLKKCGLRVTLQNYNPSIIKFSRIWVDLYDMNSFSYKEIKKEKGVNYRDDKNYFHKLKKSRNDNIINYDDEGLNPKRKTSEKNKNTNNPLGNYNRSLSGWYVITEVKYIYDSYEKNIKTYLTLNRIEHKPQFVSEYTIAKNAVEFYKEDNKITNIYRQCDDFYYAESVVSTNGVDGQNNNGNGANGTFNIPEGATKILFFGDSVTNGLAARLSQYGVTITLSIQAGGTGTSWWLKDKQKEMLKRAIDKINPDVLFVSLGTNHVAEAADTAVSNFKTFWTYVNGYGKPTVWVGPKYFAGLDEKTSDGDFTANKTSFEDMMSKFSSNFSNFLNCYTDSKTAYTNGETSFKLIHSGHDKWMDIAIDKFTATNKTLIKDTSTGKNAKYSSTIVNGSQYVGKNWMVSNNTANDDKLIKEVDDFLATVQTSTPTETKTEETNK